MKLIVETESPALATAAATGPPGDHATATGGRATCPRPASPRRPTLTKKLFPARFSASPSFRWYFRFEDDYRFNLFFSPATIIFWLYFRFLVPQVQFSSVLFQDKQTNRCKLYKTKITCNFRFWTSMVLCVENPLEDKVTTNNVRERLHFTMLVEVIKYEDF